MVSQSQKASAEEYEQAVDEHDIDKSTHAHPARHGGHAEVHRSVSGSSMNEIILTAREASEMESKMSVWHAIKAYPKAICYSMLLSTSLVMESYDLSLTRNFFGLPQFRERFGQRLEDGDYQIPAPWMSGLQNGTQVGQILGLMVAGVVAERYGYKKTIIGALALLTAFISLFFFAKSIRMLLAAGILCGLPWGAFQTLTTSYAADVTPLPLRPILTTFVNICWTMGFLVSGGVLRGLLSRPDDWAWRIPYAIQWVFPPPIIVAVLLAPESPTWLVRKGRFDDARRSLKRLTNAGTLSAEDIERKVALIEYEDKLEKTAIQGTSYVDCFKGSNLRRTEITCCVWLAQVASGISFGGNVVYFLQQVGLDPAQSFNFSLGTSGLALIGTFMAWFILSRVGRRKLYLVGLSSLLSIHLAVGFMGIPEPSKGIALTSGIFLMIFVAIYDTTIGPVCYCLVAEIPSVRLRIKTAVLARASYNIAAIGANFLNPPILNPSAWDLKGKGGFIWGAICFVMLIWCFFRLPETRGLAQVEIDKLFENRVKAQDFQHTEIDAF